jgi:hypothetical protein
MFGKFTNPFNTMGITIYSGNEGQGLIVIINSLVKLAIVMAGVYTFWNLIVAGYGFLNAGGEAKAVAKAWDRIWQSLLGLTIVASSFVLAAIFGKLIFNDATILISPVIFAPK